MKPILIFDSGLGGFSVYKHLRLAMPHANFIYLADHAGFPYGDLSEEQILERVVRIIGAFEKNYAIQGAIIACNTASTLCLSALRARFTFPIIGTVPAIKPACEQTKSKLISVLATPSTVKRDYTHQLISTFQNGAEVNLVGSTNLARISEQLILGQHIEDEAIRTEIMPCFVEKMGKKTDIIVLGCTHYPLILARLIALSPWVVQWIDPAPAIAKQAVKLLGEQKGQGTLEFITTGAMTIEWHTKLNHFLSSFK